MIKQHFYFREYDWDVTVFYIVHKYYLNEVMCKLKSIECPNSILDQVYSNLSQCDVNSGFTYTNCKAKQTVIVITRASSDKEFVNTLCHECIHLVSSITKKCKISIGSEQAGELVGKLSEYIYPCIKRIIKYYN